MESSFDARIRCAIERTLPQSPDAVYAALSRADRWSEWWPRQLRFETIEGPLGAGSRVVQHAFGYPSTLEVVRIQPPKAIWLRFIAGAYQGTAEWLIQPVEGGSRVIFQLRAEPIPRWLGLLSRFIDLGRLHGLWAAQALENLEKQLKH